MNYSIREGRCDEDDTFADFFHRMWMDIGKTDDMLVPDWHAVTTSFMHSVRTQDRFKWFAAENAERIIAVAGGHLHYPYPEVFLKKGRAFGLVWGVYVIPEFRNQGIAKALTQQVVEYFKTIGCERVRLHAAPLGKPVYENLGFKPTNEMELILNDT
jgi:GNAT superfamily N-acetyltransferase